MGDENFSLTIPAGITTCVMAPSGSGKNNAAFVFLWAWKRPLKGSITGMEGQKTQRRLSGGPSVRAAGRRLQYPSSSPRLKEDFVREQMAAIGLAGCEGQPAAELSGGMRRRTALLRGLLADWDILFLTSPSAAWTRIPKAGRWLIPAPFAKTVPWYSSPMTRRKRKESGPDGR